MTNWEKFHKGIHQTALYDPNDLSIEGLLKDMTNEPIIDVGEYPHLHFRKFLVAFL